MAHGIKTYVAGALIAIGSCGYFIQSSENIPSIIKDVQGIQRQIDSTLQGAYTTVDLLEKKVALASPLVSKLDRIAASDEYASIVRQSEENDSSTLWNTIGAALLGIGLMTYGWYRNRKEDIESAVSGIQEERARIAQQLNDLKQQ